MEEDKYVIQVEWHDELASLNRTFTLFYYTADQTIEMVINSDISLMQVTLTLNCFIVVWCEAEKDIFKKVLLPNGLGIGLVHREHHLSIRQGFENQGVPQRSNHCNSSNENREVISEILIDWKCF